MPRSPSQAGSKPGDYFLRRWCTCKLVVFRGHGGSNPPLGAIFLKSLFRKPVCCFLLLLSVNVRYCPILRVLVFVCVCCCGFVHCLLSLVFCCLFVFVLVFLFSYFLSGISIIYNMYVTVHALELKQ